MVDVNLLAVSVGNTRTRVGAFVEGKLTESATYLNHREGKLGDAVLQAFGSLRDREDAVVLMSSVNADAADVVVAQIDRHLGREIKPRRASHPDPDRAPARPGGDRGRGPSAECRGRVRRAQAGVRGGGRGHGDHGGLCRRRGHVPRRGDRARRAVDARLRCIAARRTCRRSSWPGRSSASGTTRSRRCGPACFHGTRGMVRELVEHYAEKAGRFPTVIATGGDGDLLFRDYELVEPRGARPDADGPGRDPARGHGKRRGGLNHAAGRGRDSRDGAAHVALAVGGVGRGAGRLRRRRGRAGRAFGARPGTGGHVLLHRDRYADGLDIDRVCRARSDLQAPLARARHHAARLLHRQRRAAHPDRVRVGCSRWSACLSPATWRGRWRSSAWRSWPT